MRLFFAVTVRGEARQKLETAQTAIRELCTSGRFTRPEDFHYTLFFLGEQPPTRVGDFKRAAFAAAQNSTAFDLLIDGLGSFGRGAELLLWAGAGGGLQPLCRLQAGLCGELFKIGIEPEKRPFSPHLTLARHVELKTGFAALKEAAPHGIFLRVQTLSLMESRRVSPGGPLYREIAAVRLGGESA